jgi:hypothetical protein
MQRGGTSFQSVIPVGWASSPSIKLDGQSRVLRWTSYQYMTGKMPVLPRPVRQCRRRRILFVFAIIFETPDNCYTLCSGACRPGS